ncbi:helix-turn-helix domain-containing protein [Flavihumibacter sp. UBA7668]|uniref:helix-turn-helix domain-containing protein n=1 Tax=Flavihumibacter sp. UBA7668 TaxID=1946542 RepID=UPI0025BE7AE1|nr:AraC family transcriptional regulator [Flavihumibacter sp. UBA7668]
MQSHKASLYMSPTRMMVVSPHLVADVHQHAVMQFTCSLDGSPFSVWTDSDGWQQTEGVLIDGNIAHGVKDFTGWQVTTCIIPDARKGNCVKNKVLKGQPLKYFKADEIRPVLDALQITRRQLLPDSSVFHALTDAVYDHLIGEETFLLPLDNRIVLAIRSIRQNIRDTISAAALAAEVHLSEPRFLHLFKEQIGAPLRQYVLWQRTAVAAEAFISGMSAKEAAYEAGFSDPAHFSRSFLQLFGAQPSSYAAIRPFYQFAFFQDI